MNKVSAILLALTLHVSLVPAGAFAGESPLARYRMDCRFYDSENHYCVSSATYEFCDATGPRDERGRQVCFPGITNVRYGVLCDRQTIYNNEGVAFSTTDPDSKVEDHIRPITSAVPKTVLLWQGALQKEGTYDSNLELSTHKIINGSCDITRSFRAYD